MISVRDLFFNVPARRKFLRSDQTELAHIGSLATHYSLAYPSKSFSLTNGGNDLLSVTPVETLRERVYQVFGSQVLEDLVDLGFKEREMYVPQSRDDEEPAERVFALRGFVSRPQVQKTNRNSIYLFVNNRLIRDKLLLHALSSAYHNLVPPGTLSVRAPVPRLRLRRGGRERPSVEDRGPIPPRHVRARFRPRHGARGTDGEPARLGHPASRVFAAAGRATCPTPNSRSRSFRTRCR